MLKERFDTVGKPSENVEVKIKNPNAYGHGELLIKGKCDEGLFISQIFKRHI